MGNGPEGVTFARSMSHSDIRKPNYPKIAIFSHEIPSTTFIENLLKGLADEGFEIYLFGFKKKWIQYENPRIRMFIFPESAHRKLLKFLTESLRMLLISPDKWFKLVKQTLKSRGIREGLSIITDRMIIMNRPVDIFHFQWAGDVEVYNELFDIMESKILVSFRGAHVNYAPMFRESLRKAYEKNFPKVDFFHSVSEALAKEGFKYGADPKKIKVIYTSVNPDILQINPDIKIANDNQKVFKIISVGRFHWKKGYNYALDAMLKLKEENIPFHYTIIAAGKTDEEFLFQIIQNGLQDYISIINGLPQKELASFIQQQDVFLLPSVEEGIANVAIESMALGTLVLTTDCGGMTEAITDEKDGFVIPARRADLMAQKLKYINSLPENAKTHIRNAARERVNQQFSRDRMIREFVDLYQSLYR